jgi:hypothetical protein
MYVVNVFEWHFTLTDIDCATQNAMNMHEISSLFYCVGLVPYELLPLLIIFHHVIYVFQYEQ